MTDEAQQKLHHVLTPQGLGFGTGIITVKDGAKGVAVGHIEHRERRNRRMNVQRVQPRSKQPLRNALS